MVFSVGVWGLRICYICVYLEVGFLWDRSVCFFVCRFGIRGVMGLGGFFSGLFCFICLLFVEF